MQNDEVMAQTIRHGQAGNSAARQEEDFGGHFGNWK
jgi:hypothetical protein